MKQGKEAPAVRVEKVAGGQDVIGMLAPEIQLLISLDKTIDLALYNTIKSLLDKFKKLKIVFILPKDGIVGRDLHHIDEIGKFQIVFDEYGQFGEKFQVNKGNQLITSATLVEFEGKIYSQQKGSLNTKEIEKDIQSIVDEKKKQKGHSHEDWMRY